VYFVIGIIYFAVRGRHKLVLSPEEEFAMSHGKRGANLQEEGYGRVSVTEISAGEDSPTRSP
jgi:ethanolamine permease